MPSFLRLHFRDPEPEHGPASGPLPLAYNITNLLQAHLAFKTLPLILLAFPGIPKAPSGLTGRALLLKAKLLCSGSLLCGPPSYPHSRLFKLPFLPPFLLAHTCTCSSIPDLSLTTTSPCAQGPDRLSFPSQPKPSEKETVFATSHLLLPRPSDSSITL